jgi:hypothetical protein
MQTLYTAIFDYYLGTPYATVNLTVSGVTECYNSVMYMEVLFLYLRKLYVTFLFRNMETCTVTVGHTTVTWRHCMLQLCTVTWRHCMLKLCTVTWQHCMLQLCTVPWRHSMLQLCTVTWRHCMLQLCTVLLQFFTVTWHTVCYNSLQLPGTLSALILYCSLPEDTAWYKYIPLSSTLYATIL